MKTIIKEFFFENKKEKELNMEKVQKRIEEYIIENGKGEYKLIIGTDSQCFSDYTKFVTAITIKKEGEKIWNCHRIMKYPKKIDSIRRKISLETSYTEQVMMFFKKEMIEKINCLDGVVIKYEGHIDVGLTEKNKTRIVAEEMMKRVKKLGMEPKIKPFSFVASTYANKYTK